METFNTFISGLSVVFWGVVMLSLVVVVHEAGHFTVARLLGLRVREFMIGLPGPNIGFTFKGTRFGVTPFLLGGYAAIAGMQEELTEEKTKLLPKAITLLSLAGRLDTAEVQALEPSLGFDLEGSLDTLTDWGSVMRKKQRNGLYLYEMPAGAGVARGEAREIADPEAFIASERKLTYTAAPWWKRVLMLLGGTAFNLIFAVIVFTVIMVAVGQQTGTSELSEVAADSPAASAGLVVGDRITAIDGQAVEDWDGLVSVLGGQQVGQTVSVDIAPADGTAQTETVAVTLGDNQGAPYLGVSPVVKTSPVSLGSALGRSFGMIGMVAQAIAQLFNPATTGAVLSQSTSVVGIAFIARDAAAEGFLNFIIITASISISIGLMNMLPFPPLDGGKIVLESIQRIIRRPLPVRLINTISIVGMGLMVVLFLFLTSQDIQHFIFGG
ncbi:MAG: M50 family metallopeptidase [Coriobacteriales bacterium]|jgi:regulator of sigma E protease|nr:M50 family metallopeptidase [Coriobacteriales bacterium]